VAADFATPEAARDRYRGYLNARLEASSAFVQDAIAARDEKRRAPQVRLTARR
jgi:hypothetical protein